MSFRPAAPAALLAVVGLVGAPAQAAEVQFEGFYQMRGRMFDTLSLERDLAQSEGLSWYVQHRLWLRPKFFITDKVALFADVRALDNVYWGQAPVFDPVIGLDQPPQLDIVTDDLRVPGVDDDGRTPIDISLWRAWGEVHTKIGTFKFGRMPLQWGLGVWQNDGLALNTDYGDSVDRIAWEHQVQDVWLRVAADVHTEGLINQTDDTTSFNVAAAYRTERMEGGLNFQYRHRNDPTAKFDLFTIDGAFDLELGPVGLAGEVVGQFGNGDLIDGVNDVRVTAVGAVIDAGLKLEKIHAGVEAGLATGDGNPNDEKLRTFTFDRDFNVGFMMFEQPMPVFASASGAGGGRDTSQVMTGNAVSNALYLKPRFAYRLTPGLWAEASLLAARTAKVPTTYRSPDRRGYGYEIDVSLSYEAIEHFKVMGMFGTFIPGGYFKNYADETFTTGFRDPVIAGQLLTRIEF